MIQLTLEFQLEKPELPVEYERVVVSFLKAASSNYSKEMFERLYDKSKSIIKTFTYSVYLPGAFFDKNVIRLGEEYEVKRVEVMKNNDTKLKGIQVRKKDMNVAKICYWTGESVDEIVM